MDTNVGSGGGAGVQQPPDFNVAVASNGSLSIAVGSHGHVTENLSVQVGVNGLPLDVSQLDSVTKVTDANGNSLYQVQYQDSQGNQQNLFITPGAGSSWQAALMGLSPDAGVIPPPTLVSVTSTPTADPSKATEGTGLSYFSNNAFLAFLMVYSELQDALRQQQSAQGNLMVDELNLMWTTAQDTAQGQIAQGQDQSDKDYAQFIGNLTGAVVGGATLAVTAGGLAKGFGEGPEEFPEGVDKNNVNSLAESPIEPEPTALSRTPTIGGGKTDGEVGYDASNPDEPLSPDAPPCKWQDPTGKTAYTNDEWANGPKDPGENASAAQKAKFQDQSKQWRADTQGSKAATEHRADVRDREIQTYKQDNTHAERNQKITNAREWKKKEGERMAQKSSSRQQFVTAMGSISSVGSQIGQAVANQLSAVYDLKLGHDQANVTVRQALQNMINNIFQSMQGAFQANTDMIKQLVDSETNTRQAFDQAIQRLIQRG